MQCFCKKNIAQVLLNAEFNDLATLCVKEAAAERRGREAALIARRQPASRWPPRVLRSPFCRSASRGGGGPRAATAFPRSASVLLFSFSARSAHSTSSCCCTWPLRPVRRSGFDCCRCSLIVLHIVQIFSWLSFLFSFLLKKLGYVVRGHCSVFRRPQQRRNWKRV